MPVDGDGGRLPFEYPLAGTTLRGTCCSTLHAHTIRTSLPRAAKQHARPPWCAEKVLTCSLRYSRAASFLLQVRPLSERARRTWCCGAGLRDVHVAHGLVQRRQVLRLGLQLRDGGGVDGGRRQVRRVGRAAQAVAHLHQRFQRLGAAVEDLSDQDSSKRHIDQVTSCARKLGRTPVFTSVSSDFALQWGMRLI